MQLANTKPIATNVYLVQTKTLGLERTMNRWENHLEKQIRSKKSKQ